VKDIPLIKSNSYLKNPTKRYRLLAVAVNSSTAIEGVHVIVGHNKTATRKINGTKKKTPSAS